MEPGICLTCGKRISGRVKNIALTLYCNSCIYFGHFLAGINLPRHRLGRPYLIFESTARNSCKQHPQDLEAVQFEIVRRGIAGVAHFQKRYIAAEVRSLCLVSQERKSKEIEKRRIEKAARKQALINKTGIQLDALNPYVRHYLLGDYLSGALHTTTSALTVLKRCHVLPRVMEIMNQCPKAHPEGVFWFCLTCLCGGPTEFQELKENMRLVLQLHGFRILDFLSIRNVVKLRGTILSDVCQAYIDRDHVVCVRSYLEPLVGLVTAETITKDPHYCEIIRRRGCTAGFSDRFTAREMAKMWSEQEQQKQEHATEEQSSI